MQCLILVQAVMHELSVDNGRLKLPLVKVRNEVNGTPNALTEQNRGPRTTTSSAHLTVKAYSSRARHSDAQGNITITMDQFNKDDFPIDYVNV